MNKNNPILELSNLTRTYKIGNTLLPVLQGINLRLEAGCWCCIYGASGSGKTTLLNLLGALERPDSGTVKIDGVEISALSARAAAKFRGEKIGFVFQAYHLLPELPIIENVALAGRLAGITRRIAQKKAEELLNRVGLSNRLDHRPCELSGGEQQRAAIARALMNSPKLLLADEPTGNLDEKTGAGILELFTELKNLHPEQSIVMITHNQEISKLADRICYLHNGILESKAEL